MNSNEEVTPLSSGTEEVSSNNATDEGADAPSTVSPEGTPASVVMIACKQCGASFERKRANSKYCSSCAPSRQTITRKNRAEGKKAASYVYDSKVEASKADALRLLQERGLQNEHVLDFCYDLALIAAELNHVTPNKFYFQNGLRKTLESLEAEAPQALEEIPAEEVLGELLNRVELFAQFDFGFWRHPEVSFEQWLKDRFTFKTSAFEMSKILGKEDFGDKHIEWTEFAPRWNPIGLKPNYTQREALQWLDSQRSDTEGDKKRYLLVASRNSMKSTWARIHALCLTICCPDAAIRAVSETNKLTKDGMTEWKGYVEMNPHNPSLFQQYFGEITVLPDSGQKLVYKNPLAHLSLPQPSFSQSSMKTANTGSRFWYCIFDDPVSNQNFTANEEQRAEGLRKYGAVAALAEPAAFILNIQTPWIEDDLADVMIKRNNEDSEHALAVRVDPVMAIKREASHKPLHELREEDVILNFLPKLNWKFVRSKMTAPEGISFFKTQYLCQWIKQSEGVSIIFEEDDLRNHLRRREFFTGASLGSTYLALDRATSVSAGADFTFLGCIKIMPVAAYPGAKPKMSMVLWDCVLDRLKESAIVDKVVDFCSLYKPNGMVAQKDRGNEQDLDLAIRKRALIRNAPGVFIRWVPTNSGDRQPLQKARRIKALELPLSQDQLWFAAGSIFESRRRRLERFSFASSR